MPKYTFDCILRASFTVEAADPETARKAIEKTVDCATINAEAIFNGDPLVGEASLDSPPELASIDGNDVPEAKGFATDQLRKAFEETYLQLIDNHGAWAGEEDSVQEEHAALIDRNMSVLADNLEWYRQISEETI